MDRSSATRVILEEILEEQNKADQNKWEETPRRIDKKQEPECSIRAVSVAPLSSCGLEEAL